MPSSSFESASVYALYFLAAMAGVLLICLNLPIEIQVDPKLYFLSHSLLESAGILIAAMIFVLGWATLEDRRTVRTTILTSAFLGLGLMEMAHLVTFDGTFANSLENAKATSIKLTLAAQSFAVIGLLCFAYCPVRSISKGNANVVHSLIALISGTIIVIIFRTTDATATIINPETGPSTTKILFEIGVGVLFSIAGLKLFMRSVQSKNYPALTIAIAAFVLGMSVFLFSSYMHINELNSLIGHLYKLAAYMLLFRALVLKNIEQPYFDIRDLKQRFESTLNALPDLVFELSRDGFIYQYHSDANRDQLLADPEEFIGHNLSEYLPPEACNACMKALQESSEKGESYGQQYSLMLPDGERQYEISASALNNIDAKEHYLMIVRDISIRHSLTQRLEAILTLAEQSEGLNAQEVAQLGLDTLEKLTKSKVSFLHFLSPDEREIELMAWGTATEKTYCKEDQEQHRPPELAGIWAQCVKTREAVIINDYAQEPNKNPLPDGHCELTRFVSVPIFEGERIGMIIGMGNAEYKYNANTVTTVELFGNELYQIVQRRRAQSDSEKSRLLLTSALEVLPVGVAIAKRGATITFEYFNKQFPALYGVDPSLITNFDSFWGAAITEENLRSEMKAKMIEDFTSGDPVRLRWERVPINHNGHTRYLTVQTVLVSNTDLSVTLVEDVTETMRKEEEIRIAATAFSSQEGILITDADMRILRVNEAFQRSSGYSAKELIGKTPAFLQSGQQNAHFYKQMWTNINQHGVWRGEIWNKSKSGEVAPFSLTISAVKDALGKITHFVADYVDLSDIKTAQDTISRLSYFDTLTGLPNREHLKNMLSKPTLKTQGADEYIGALMIDVDNFKTINETLGHESGDLLLLQVAQRLQSLLRNGDKVARYGGDEFVLLLMNLGSNAEQASLKIQLVAQSVIHALEDNYSIQNKAYFSTASIGATLLKAAKPNAQEVFKQLDIALSSAKNDGNNQIRFFDPAWQESVNVRARLLEELRIAITEHQLELHYQPQINALGEIVGAEGLIRWNHPTRGLLPPSEFLPIAQENHLMIKLGDEVLRLGLKQLHKWQSRSALSNLQLSLNITAEQFYEGRFESALLGLLKKFSITPGSLMLEFTESMILGSVDAAREKIVRLNEADVEFAIDDFGTGYSSLSYLSTLPMDQLKIDQSFVRNIGVIESDAQIVRAIIDMAHTLKLGVIAEGVETAAQLEYLKAQGCEMFQGYLFSKPIPVAAFEQFVLASKRQMVPN